MHPPQAYANHWAWACVSQLSERRWLTTSLCFVDDADPADAAAWQSEEVGGFECFLSGDKDGEAATAEVRAATDDKQELTHACN